MPFGPKIASVSPLFRLRLKFCKICLHSYEKLKFSTLKTIFCPF